MCGPGFSGSILPGASEHLLGRNMVINGGVSARGRWGGAGRERLGLLLLTNSKSYSSLFRLRAQCRDSQVSSVVVQGSVRAFDITMVALCCPSEYWKVTGHPVAWRPDLEKVPPGTSGLGQQQSRDSGCWLPRRLDKHFPWQPHGSHRREPLLVPGRTLY